VQRLETYRAEYGRTDGPFQVIAAATDAFDIDGYRRLEDAGVTHLQTMPWAFYGDAGDTLEGKRTGLQRFADDVIAKMS
jgi:hypothetical protein